MSRLPSTRNVLGGRGSRHVAAVAALALVFASTPHLISLTAREPGAGNSDKGAFRPVLETHRTSEWSPFGFINSFGREVLRSSALGGSPKSAKIFSYLTQFNPLLAGVRASTMVVLVVCITRQVIDAVSVGS